MNDIFSCSDIDGSKLKLSYYRPPFWEPHFCAYFAALFARCRNCEQPRVDSRLVAMASDGGIKEQTRGGHV